MLWADSKRPELVKKKGKALQALDQQFECILCLHPVIDGEWVGRQLDEVADFVARTAEVLFISVFEVVGVQK